MRDIMVRVFLCGCAVSLVAPLALAAPVFSDQQLQAGVLNPGDTAIHVQTVRVIGDALANTVLYAVSVRNNGTATHHQIVRFELWDGGLGVAVVNDTLGIDTAGGVTAPMVYTVPAGATRDLQCKVWIGGAGAVAGGETCELALKFYYTVGAAIDETGWVKDAKPETIAKAGFELVTDGAVPATGFNPSDSGVVQVATWTDHDANASPIVIRRIVIRNLDSATADDVRSMTVRLRHGGGDLPDVLIPDLTGWNTVGVDYPLDSPLVINDQDTLLCEISVTISMTPTESRRIRTKVTLELDENAERFIQSSASPATHVISRGGIEEVVDESRVMDPPVLNPGQSLVQTVTLQDRDTNSDPVEVTKIRLRNTDGATALGSDLVEIIVRGPTGLLGSTTDTRDFHTVGVEIPLPRFIVPNDGAITLTITYRIGEAGGGRTLRPEVDVWGEEARGAIAWSPKAAYPAPVYLYPAGFEIAENVPFTGGRLSSTVHACVQKILLRDWDQNSNSVLINPIVVRNLGTADALDLVKIEIRTSAGDLLGEATNLGGLRAGGVTISTTRGSTVTDDNRITLEIWITVAAPERDVTGKTVRLETRVLHTEGGVGYMRTIAADEVFTLIQNYPPQVDFIWAPSEPIWKDSIVFTPTSSDPDAGDSIVYSRWDLGDGTVVERDGPPQPQTHTYRAGGTYTVVVIVRDSYGLEGRKSKAVVVTGNRPPTVDFTWAPESPTWDTPVTFSARVTDPDGDAISGYRWEFGDGSAAEEGRDLQTASHRYPDGGTFSVVLTATDEWGASGTATKTVTVALRPNTPPTVDFTWSPLAPRANEEVTFSSRVTDSDDPPDTPFAFAWAFGDGATSERENPVHVYTTAGEYTVRLTVTDRRGASGSKEYSLTVAAAAGPPPPTVTRLSADPAVPEVDVEVTLTAEATAPAGDPVTGWEWDLGDGSAVRQTTAGTLKYTFRTSGYFVVRVRARNAQGGWSAEWRTLNLYVRPRGGALIGTKLLNNPASTTARIQIFLPPGATNVSIQIFDMLGREVRRSEVTGTQFTWDLRDGNGRSIADGLYFYLITATVEGKTERSETGKILVVR